MCEELFWSGWIAFGVLTVVVVVAAVSYAATVRSELSDARAEASYLRGRMHAEQDGKAH